MALNIRIDFANRYQLQSTGDDLTEGSFITTLKTGAKHPMTIRIGEEQHPLMSNVYNLAFGPLDEFNGIDDQAKIPHENYSKVFSTIVFYGFTYLEQNKTKYLGIDGFGKARAYMYYRSIQNNHDYLSQYFRIYGVKYYVRILREDMNDDDSLDEDDILTTPELIIKGNSIDPKKLYNYFIFNLKEG